jgi:hypothetical protein
LAKASATYFETQNEKVRATLCTRQTVRFECRAYLVRVLVLVSVGVRRNEGRMVQKIVVLELELLWARKEGRQWPFAKERERGGEQDNNLHTAQDRTNAGGDGKKCSSADHQVSGPTPARLETHQETSFTDDGPDLLLRRGPAQLPLHVQL